MMMEVAIMIVRIVTAIDFGIFLGGLWGSFAGHLVSK